VATFLRDHFLPYVEEERVQKSRTIHANTFVKYRGYVDQKVVPLIGNLRIGEVSPGQIERLLNQLRVGGRDPMAAVGRPRGRPAWVYDRILARRADG
jgi:hypothetical protein